MSAPRLRPARRGARRLPAFVAAVALAASPFLPWIDAAGGRPAASGRSVPLRDLLTGITDDAARLGSSAAVVVLGAAVLAALAVLAAPRAGRRLAALAAVAATAVLADWVVLEAVHRAPGDARIGDVGAGAWLLLLGALLAAAAAVPVRRQGG